jgi:EAL domain-containing protein (putative c-di-GMP-specific phosphodiesterase class I)
MPDEFIETLERAGLIHLLDMYMWECAVKQLAAWNGTDRQALSISVNMSAKDFYSVDVYEILTELTGRYHVPPARLRLEITETALLEDPESGNEVISRLRRMGFLVEVDDFGKGYSSLGLLRDIRADVLKIDMSLLRGIESEQRNRAIVASIINMAGSLGMDVITEGVETGTQLKSLIDMGCHRFQGYYFSCPITVEQFEASTHAS